MKLVVVGRGAAGSAIARASATAGHDVAVRDGHDEPQRGPESITGGTTDTGKRDGAPGRVAETASIDCLSGMDLVIEAVSGESSGGLVPAAEVTSALERPERAVGLRFPVPIDLLEVVEVVVTERTDDSVVELAEEFVESLGKEAVVIRDRPGLVASRSGVAISVEAIRMVERGVASPRAIDRTMELGYEHPTGPLELVDRVGLDARLAVLEDLSEELGERFRPPRLLERKVDAGDLGRKTGEGFYVWEDGERVDMSGD